VIAVILNCYRRVWTQFVNHITGKKPWAAYVGNGQVRVFVCAMPIKRKTTIPLGAYMLYAEYHSQVFLAGEGPIIPIGQPIPVSVVASAPVATGSVFNATDFQAQGW
jgi:hypothetical protein